MQKNPTLIIFGENLRKIRKIKGFSQEYLALESGFDRTYVSLLERGLRNPSLLTIQTLSSFLQVDIKLLIEGC
jgi:transcriptional regulator with XRE-family HTH domain